MRFTNGWVKVHRKLASPEWCRLLDATGKGVFLELLLMANVKDSRIISGTDVKIIKRGELVFGVRQLAAQMGLTRAVFSKRIQILEKLGTIALKKSHLGTTLTICKYNEYQERKKSAEATKEPPTVPPESHLEATGSTLIKELKKEKNLKKEKKIPPPISQEWVDLGSRWLQYGLKEMPWQSKQPNWTAEAFGRELMRIGPIMRIQAPGFYELLSRIETDEFWRKQAASPFGLMSKGKNGNRKIDNILVSLKTKRDREQEALAKFASSEYTGDGGIPF